MMGEQSQVGNSIDWSGQWVKITVRFRRVNVSGGASGYLELVEKRELGNTRGCFLLAGWTALCKWFFSLPCVGTGRIQLDVHLRQDELQCSNEQESSWLLNGGKQPVA